MKKILLLAVLFISFTGLSAQTWTQKSNFPGTERYAATGFEIDGKLYFGTGYNGVTFMNDWWEYNPATDQWTQKTSYPGTGRLHASAFVINNKGYIVFGSTTTGIYTFPTDFWEYDPVNNHWTQKANFPGPGRYTGVAIEINGKGYAGTGWKQFNNPVLSDWWEYDPVTNSWTQKANFTGGQRRAAMGFSLHNKGYLGMGEGPANIVFKDLWEYNPITNSWTQKADFISYGRVAGGSFSINNYGYMGGGVNGEFGNILFNDYYKYDPLANSWSYAGGFHPPRFGPVSIASGDCAYIITGKTTPPTDPVAPQNMLTDFWEFCLLTSIVELAENEILTIENPIYNNGILKISNFKGGDIKVNLFSISGSYVKTLIQEKNLRKGDLNYLLDLSGLSAGTYLIKSETHSNILNKKLIIVK